MFTITDAAGAHLTTMLENANASEETAIRFVLEGSTLTPKLDSARPGDTTFDHEDRTVLVLEAQVSDTLGNATLDVQPTDEGSKLVLLR
jgi:Fe-S cluster assembly iron-binding protein IscA